MYTVGAKTATVDAFTQSPALVQTADGQYVPATQLVTVPASQLVGTARPQLVSSPSVVRHGASSAAHGKPVGSAGSESA